MLGTSNAWLTSHSSRQTSILAYYIADCWIFGLFEPYGQGSMHHTLDFCIVQPCQMYQSLKKNSYGLTIQFIYCAQFLFIFFFELQKIYQFHADFMPMIAENDKTLSANCFFDSSFFQMMYLYDIAEGASAQFLICSFLV